MAHTSGGAAATGLRLEKAGLRGLAIAESCTSGAARSVLAGVVMRRDLTIDGFVTGGATVGGDDATDEILDMYARLGRTDISYVLVSGAIISAYNIINVARIHKILDMPVISVTYRDSDGIGRALRRRFADHTPKVARYAELGERNKITLHTLHEIFVRCAGCTVAEAGRLLDGLTIQGTLAEPLRVARLLARVLASH